MESSDLKATGSLANKFKILNISGPGHYRCYSKKLQEYLSGNPGTISPSIQPADLEQWSGKRNQTTFTRQSSQRTTKFFSAVPKLSENEYFNRHSLCGFQTVKMRNEVSPQNILEYSYSGAKRICGECGLLVFELDFAFICSVCGQLIHKGCTDVCKRRHECVICGEDTNANRIYPFCQINNMSELINGVESGKKAFKGPTKTQAEKCFPIIRTLRVPVTTEVNHGSEKRPDSKKRLRQSKHSSEYVLPQPSKRRKIESVKLTAHSNTQTRRRTRRSKATVDVLHGNLQTTCNALKDVANKRLKNNRCKSERARLNTKEEVNKTTRTILKEGISLFVSKTLDFLGYSFEMIKYRQRMYHADDELTARFSLHPDTRVTTGGKGEGTTMYFENDADYMYVVKQLICTDHPLVFVIIKNITVFLTKRNMTSPGYTRLELIRFSGRYRRDEIRTSLVQSQSGALYLSSEAFIASLQITQDKTCSLGGFGKGARSGPSTPISDKYNSYDDVVGLPCCCLDLLQKWFSRPRPHRWPPQAAVHAISLLDANVVPVGFKGSSDQYLEWRICFSLAELHLMQMLNECQIQTYILLKKIAKTCLQPISKDITSYVVKNTILWICEKTPISFFQKKHVLHRLLDSIEFLRQCIRKNNLPSYMISERNLIAGRLDRSQRHQLENILGDLKREEGQIFLRIGQLREAMLVMYKMPTNFREYGEKRNILERIVLMRNWIRESAWKPNMTKAERNRLAEKHKGYKILEREIDDMLQVDEEQLEGKGWMFAEINDLWMDRMYQLLS